MPTLIKKIRAISSHAEQIHLYSEDGINFTRNILPTYDRERLFTYFDPPYYDQGQFLYKNGLTDDYHSHLANVIQNLIHYKWTTTYDNVQRIRDLYEMSRRYIYTLHYTVNRKRHEQELLFTNQYTEIESFDNVSLNSI